MAQLPPKAATRSRDRVDRFREQLATAEDVPLPGRAEDALAEIRHEWPFMLDDNFQDVPLALDLLEGHGRRNQKTFHEALDRLESAISIIGDVNADGFNLSVRTFTNVMDSLKTSREKAAAIRQMLLQSKDYLQLKQTDLLGLWIRNNEYREMLRIIDMVDDLNKTPPKIETLVQSKYYYAAVTKLMEALKAAESPECQRIPALNELRKTFHTIKDTLYEALIDEVAALIYLKAPYSYERWTAVLHRQVEDKSALKSIGKNMGLSGYKSNVRKHSVNGSSGGGGGSGGNSVSTGGGGGSGGSGGSGEGNRPDRPGHRRAQSGDMRQIAAPAAHNRLSSTTSDEVFIFEDFDVDPEQDSLNFLRVCIESLLLIERLADALEVLRQRISLELFQMIDRTVTDFEERRENASMENSTTIDKQSDIRDIHSLRDTAKQPQLKILREFMDMLYAQLECVMESHKLICNLVDGMTRRQKFSELDENKFLVYTIQDVWSVVQAELRNLIMDYVRPSGNASQLTHLREIGKPKKASRSPREMTSKSLFKFVNSDTPLSVQKVYNAVDINILAQALPQHVSSTSQPGNGVIDQFASRNDTLSHRPVIAPDPENISVIFLPTISVMDRLERWVSSGSAKTHDFHQFLDDFVRNSFIPQIEEKLMGYVQKYISGPDSFVVDSDSNLAGKPLLRSTVSLISLICSLCATIHNVPFHREEFVRMIEGTISRYIEKCFAKYRSATSIDSIDEEGASECVSGVWADTADLVRVVEENTHFRQEDLDLERNERLNVKEIILESHLAQDRSFERVELIFDRRKLEILACMPYSLRWAITELRRLQTADVEEAVLMRKSASVASMLSIDKDLPQTMLMDDLNLTDNINADMEGIKSVEKTLQLNHDEAERIRRLLKTFDAIANTCLVTLRLELRCHVIYYLDLAMREGSYYLDDDICEPDSYILHLNDDLIIFEDIITNCLMQHECRFIFDGISLLITHYLIANVRYIKRLNRNGVTKMIRNISALHQNLVNIDLCDDMRLSHAKGYYELYVDGAERLLTSLETNMAAVYSHEEYQNMLNYIFDTSALPDLKRHDVPSVAAAAIKAEQQWKEAASKLNEVMRRIESA